MEVNKYHPLVSVGDSIRDAIKIVDRFAKKTCYVLEGRKLVGLATDGDIRRALLEGALLDDKIESAMNRHFVSFPYFTQRAKLFVNNFHPRLGSSLLLMSQVNLWI